MTHTPLLSIGGKGLQFNKYKLHVYFEYLVSVLCVSTCLVFDFDIWLH